MYGRDPFGGGHIWFVKDVCGIICAIFTWMLLLFSQYVVLTCILIPEENVLYKSVNFVIFELFSFLAFVSHFRTMCTDPGAVPRGTATKEAIEQLGLSEGQVLYKCQKVRSIQAANGRVIKVSVASPRNVTAFSSVAASNRNEHTIVPCVRDASGK